MRPPAGCGVSLGDAPSRQRRRIEDVFVAAADEDDGILRRDAIEIVAQRQPLFLQLRFVPVAVGDDHVAGLRGLRRARCSAASTSAIDRARDRSTPGPPPAPWRWLSISPGITAAALEIDHPRRRAGDRAHLIVVADGHDAIADDRDRFVDEKLRSTVMTLPLKRTRSGAGGRGRIGRCAASAAAASSRAIERAANHAGSISALGPSVRPSNFADASLVSGRSTNSAAILTRWGRAPALGVDDTAARLLVTPLVGVAVPNLAGMVEPRRAFARRPRRDLCSGSSASPSSRGKRTSGSTCCSRIAPRG